ncbi:hypothetical protein Pint_05099 [Pistacia integerrima]|uniref:Uncharacterized protein n=1 Tax=Pistacia integerrima TaxID=434235 RepID=A0ACC0Z5U2_9ROSI|nr:hypothetical protein Pint_05099 [Pistacia integerrima]
MLFQSDELCFERCRMNRALFHKLCNILTIHDNLKSTRYSSVEELVGTFLHILAHNQKTRVMKRQMRRSTETVSRNFHLVLNVVLRLHTLLFKKLEAIHENSTDERWKWFKNCLGALDGTYIKVHVPADDIPRYRSRKSEIATNVLGVCTLDILFILGQYYLCDAGYTNGEGFLALYRGQRYHLSEWRQGHQPASPQEFFNMKHSQAGNCIERCFDILKARWGILEDTSY